MTKPDTNAAPKRIYLDIGEQFVLEAVTAGTQRWDLLEGVTWSEDNATSHGIPYVRADLAGSEASALRQIISDCAAALGKGTGMSTDCSLDFMRLLPDEIRAAVTTPPAASGAAPADEREAFEEWVRSQKEEFFEKALDRHGEGYVSGMVSLAWECWKARASLASPQVAPALTDEQIAEACHGIYRCDFPDGVGYDIAIGRAVLALAAPVQVAPAGFKLVPIKPQMGMEQAALDACRAAGYSTVPACHELHWASLCWSAMLAAAPATPMQPGAAADDARDAARYRFIRDVPYAPGLRTVMTHQLNARMDDVIDELLSTPAAKPAEEQS